MRKEIFNMTDKVVISDNIKDIIQNNTTLKKEISATLNKKRDTWSVFEHDGHIFYTKNSFENYLKEIDNRDKLILIYFKCKTNVRETVKSYIMAITENICRTTNDREKIFGMYLCSPEDVDIRYILKTTIVKIVDRLLLNAIQLSKLIKLWERSHIDIEIKDRIENKIIELLYKDTAIVHVDDIEWMLDIIKKNKKSYTSDKLNSHLRSYLAQFI